MKIEEKKEYKIDRQQAKVPYSDTSNKYNPLEDEREYIQGIGKEDFDKHKQKQSPFTKRIKKGALVLVATAVLSTVAYCMTSTSTSVDTSEDAVSALESHTSTILTAGTRLLSKDDNYVGGDITITHESKDKETTLYVWDYAAEDGDYVQILVNGTALSEPFMIKNKPVTFTVPTSGEIQVIGTRDGGGGITYAAYYTMNHTTYFNGMNEGGDNIYTLIRE